MLHLIIGGSGSGKSEYAEAVAKGLFEQLHTKQDLIYIATMYHYPDKAGNTDAEMDDRIKKHQLQRAGKGFQTVEQYVSVEDVFVKNNPKEDFGQLNGNVYLLECMSNLLANEMYLPEGNLRGCLDDRFQVSKDEAAIREFVEQYVIEPMKQALEQGIHLVVVTNEIFSDGNEKNYDGSTQMYIKMLGYINKKLAQIADSVTEVCCGIPIKVKGDVTSKNS